MQLGQVSEAVEEGRDYVLDKKGRARVWVLMNEIAGGNPWITSEKCPINKVCASVSIYFTLCD